MINQNFKFSAVVSKFLLFLLLLGMTNIAESQAQKKSTAASNVQILEKVFIIPGLERQRTIRLYLPPNYQHSTISYPVLYMHDGQNLFDDATSYVGEWGVDETLNKLYKEKKLSLIVVGIDNGQALRMNELSPWENKKYGKAEGELYMQFIVEVVKPYIDKNYRTLSDSANTAIMGSSMGGLISHYAIFEYPQVFSKAGVFSPSYWYSDSVYEFTRAKKLKHNSRLFLLMGGEEGLKNIDNMQKMVNQIKQQGLPAKQIVSDVVAKGQHNEQFWRAHFERAISWLFSKE